jgi:UDP-4-amino-4,6-dideoxy-N-acetyl-beta-L-altrosamine N-acetyltransferase
MRALALVNDLRLEPIGALSRSEQLEILRIRNQKAVRDNMYTSHVIDEAEHFAWIEQLASSRSARFFAVYHRDKIVGGVNLRGISESDRRADWGFYLDEATHGQGLGTALELKFLDFAFGEAGFQKLNYEVLEFNEPVLAMQKRFGFVEEGFRRGHILRDGKAWGVHLLGLTAEEWAERRPKLISPVPRDAGYYLDIIDRIEQIRGKNNKNWMDLLRLSFRLSPEEAANIMAQIYTHDHDISALIRELTEK